MITTIRFTDFDGLLNMGVSDFSKTRNELSACKNVYVYKLGKLEKVPGYSIAGANSQVINDKSVSFLHWYYRPSTNFNYLIASSDSGTALTLKYIAPNLTPSAITTWTTLAGISTLLDGYATAIPSMINYLDKVFIVGYKSGTTYLPNATITGTTYATSDGTNLTNMPQGKYIVRYRDLLYVLNAYSGSTAYPSRAYYNDEITTGAITWTPATKFVVFGYDDGDEITGGIDAFDRLLVFKHYTMFKYDESQVIEIPGIGCDSFRSIKKIGAVPYWYNRKGFYRYNGGDAPQLISRKVQPFIDAMDQNNPQNVIAGEYEFEYRAYLGDSLTVEGITYTNVWYCFNTLTEKCYIRCTYNKGKSCSSFVNTGKKRLYFGDDDGCVYLFNTKIDNVYADAYYSTDVPGQEIDSFFITRNIDYSYPELLKQTNQITVFSKNCQGMKVAIDVDDSDKFQEKGTQVLKRNIDILNVNTEGYRYKFKFYEKSKNKSWELEGFCLNTQSIENYQ